MPFTSDRASADRGDLATLPLVSSSEDQIRLLKRRLLGVTGDQLLDEVRLYERRKAGIEARAQQR